MPKYFTYLWTNDEWIRKAKDSANPFITYAASNQFQARGVVPGSVIYIVTVRSGNLYLGGRLDVEKILSRAGASVHLGIPEDNLWQAEEYAVCNASAAKPFTEELLVKDRISHFLEIKSSIGFRNPKINSDGKLDQQTFRGVRELYGSSYLQLERLLGS